MKGRKFFLSALALAGALSATAQTKKTEFKIGLLGDIQPLNSWGSNDIKGSALKEAVLHR